MFNTTWVKDTLERAVKTFLQTFATLMLGSITVTSEWADYITAGRSAATAAVAAGLSVIMSALSEIKTDGISPASLVSPPRH